MSSLTDHAPFLLTLRGKKNLIKAAGRSRVPGKNGVRELSIEPSIRVHDEHPWGWSYWAIPRERYAYAYDAHRAARLDVLMELIDLVRITVIDPRRAVVDSKGHSQVVTSLMPHGRHERRRASIGAGIAAVPGAGLGALPIAADPTAFGIALGAGSAVAMVGIGAVGAVADIRRKGSRNAWATGELLFRKPWLPLLPGRRRTVASEPVMPLDLYEAIGRATFAWSETSTLVSEIPALVDLHSGVHGRMYEALGAAPSWTSSDLPKVIDHLHRYVDLIDKELDSFEKARVRIARQRKHSEPDPEPPFDVPLDVESAEDDLQRHEHRLQAYQDLQRGFDGFDETQESTEK